MRRLQSGIAILCVALMLAPAVCAQDIYVQDQPGGRFSAFTHPYEPKFVPPIDLANSNRLDMLLRAGNIYLSLQDAIALALENNLDIQIQRYGRPQANANLLRAQGGYMVSISPLAGGVAGAAGGFGLAAHGFHRRRGIARIRGKGLKLRESFIESRGPDQKLRGPHAHGCFKLDTAVQTQFLAFADIGQGLLRIVELGFAEAEKGPPVGKDRRQLDSLPQSVGGLGKAAHLIQGAPHIEPALRPVRTDPERLPVQLDSLLGMAVQSSLCPVRQVVELLSGGRLRARTKRGGQYESQEQWRS